MQQRRLEGLRVAVLVTDDFEQSELVEPMKALRDAGATVQIVSPKANEVQGMRHDEKADKFPVDVQLSKANPDEYDAVLIPGGALNADALRVIPEAQRFVRRMDEVGKPVAAICHGPWLLVSAGLVNGRTLTSYHTIQDDIRNAGGYWMNLDVVRDRNWVTSRQPSDIPAFNKQMIDLFSEYREYVKQRKAA
jgi:protease I